VFDPNLCRREIGDLKALLASKANLDERKEIQPFFKARKQLSAFLGASAFRIGPAKRLEFPFMGGFAADLVVGNAATRTYCIVELEDAKRNSIFRKARTKATTEWSALRSRSASLVISGTGKSSSPRGP
jgi:hypothetical protein